MSFDVAAESYGKFMGRFSAPLAGPFADVAGVRPGHTALDVGCGTGALTDILVERLGVPAVSAIDPSPPFVAALRERFPDLDVRPGVAEELPFPDDGFDVAVAQLVVHFMSDPVAGLREMARVTRPGGVVAACVWDHAGGIGPVSPFWRAVRDLDPEGPDESDLPGSREGHLAELCAAAGLEEVESRVLTVRVRFPTFEDWWEPYTLGVGPAGAYLATLDDGARETLKSRCAEQLAPEPFEISASAWCVRALAQR